jgi:hypothetical protein
MGLVVSNWNFPAMTMPLLPQQIVPVSREQAALTGSRLAGLVAEMEQYFLALRAETDAVLAPRFPFAGGKPYPYGRCEEITRDLFARLAQRLGRPTGRVEVALRDFAAQGGMVRTVWGVLRERYFQNALQVGGLYVDVSNDTVVTTKPKVEILPIAECGLVSVRDVEHFRETAALYWGAAIYANHLAPSLAPLLPMVSANPARLQSGLQSACDYMIALMIRDGFRTSQKKCCRRCRPICGRGPAAAARRRWPPAGRPEPPAARRISAGGTRVCWITCG